MLYNLIQTRRGKETVVMTDNLQKVNDRLKTLRQSQRKGIKGDRITYEIKPADETIKYRKPPVFGFDPSGDAPKVKIKRQKAKKIKNKAKRALEKRGEQSESP